LNAIKKEAGKDFPVIYQVGLKQLHKGKIARPWSGILPGDTQEEAGRDIVQGLELARFLENAGFDAVQIDAGCFESRYWAHPPVYQAHACMVDLAAMVKSVIDVPVIAVGRLDIPELAEGVLAKGQADIIALGRGLLADPYCLEGQERRSQQDQTLYRLPFLYEENQRGPKAPHCAVNPACGKNVYITQCTSKSETDHGNRGAG